MKPISESFDVIKKRLMEIPDEEIPVAPKRPEIKKLLVKENYDIIDEQLYDTIFWEIKEKKGFSYLFCGGVGNGKTELAKAIYETLVYLNNPLTPVFITAKQLWENYISVIKRKDEDAHRDYQEIVNLSERPVFFLDELTREATITGANTSMKPVAFIGNIIEKQYEYRKKTKLPVYSIMTANVDLEELRRIYDEHVFDRLIEEFQVVVFNNPSYRKKKMKKPIPIGGSR